MASHSLAVVNSPPFLLPTPQEPMLCFIDTVTLRLPWDVVPRIRCFDVKTVILKVEDYTAEELNTRA